MSIRSLILRLRKVAKEQPCPGCHDWPDVFRFYVGDETPENPTVAPCPVCGRAARVFVSRVVGVSMDDL